MGIDIDGDTTAALVAGITGLAPAAYYTTIRALETRWPILGVLLGRCAAARLRS